MVCDSGALGPAGAACSAHRDVVAGAERLFGGVANARDTVAAGVASLASDGLINASAAVAPALSRMFGPVPTDVPPPVPAPDPAPPPVAPGVNPPPPPGAGGTTSGAGTSGDKHRAGTASVEGLDEQLVATVNEALTGNRVAQDQITGILQEIEARHTQLSTAGPDSAALSSYQQYLDQQLGRVQQILITAQADADAKRQVLDGIAEEYRQTGPAPAGPPIDAGGDGGGGGAAGAGGGDGAGGGQGAGAGGAADGTVQDQVQAELARIMAVDPFGPGGMPGGAAGLAEALGPALGGLGGIGGSLAGLGAAPFGALGPVLGSLGQLGAAGGAGGGFTDPGPKDPKTVDAGFTDKPKDEDTDKPKDGDTDDKPKTVDAGFTDESEGDGAAKDETVGGDNKVQPVSTGPEVRTAPVAAAPATAAAQAPVDAGRSVVLPDGTPVTASNEKAAAATRAVLGGTDVTAAYQAQGVQIPPPGTPVTSPVDPSRLEPGDIASFEGRPPVMAAGNGKVWMDGQLQPLSAMGSAEDFLGWSRPTGAPAAVLTADSPAPAAGTPPVTATPPS